MKLRDLLILIALLFLLSTLIGLGVLLYFYVWGPPAALQDPLAALQTATHTPQHTATQTAPPQPVLSTATGTLTPEFTATPTATPTLTATATETPTLTPTPDQTLAPAARLAAAHRAKQNGDYQQARIGFRAVLEAPAAEWEAVEALYELGLCAYMDGEYDAARDLLQQFIAGHPQDHRLPQAHFYLAQTLDELNLYAEAVTHYQAYLDRQDVLADRVHTRIGDSWMALLDYEAAAEAYQRALETAPDLGQQYDLREQIGVAYSSAGQYDKAIEWLHPITQESQNVHRLARLWYLIGQVHRMAGRDQEAIDAFSHAVYGDPQPGYAYAALIVLVESFVEVDDYQRGLIDYYAASYPAAVTAFYSYMENNPDYNSDAHYYVALSYLSAGSLDLAIQETERALERYPNTIPHWGDLWLVRGRALAQAGRLDEAVAIYLQFADENIAHPLAPQARWEAAQLLEKESRFVDAAAIYVTLADRHVNAETAPAARFRAGICRYQAGDSDAALGAWRDLVNGYPAREEALAGRYWLGKVLWAQGQADEARTTLQTLAESSPRSYYGLRARHMLDHDGRSINWSSTPLSIHLTSDEEAEKQEAEAWLRNWAGATGEDLSAVPEEMASSIPLRRGMELLALGERSAAQDEFDLLRKEIGADPVGLYRVAMLTRDLGLYAASMRAAIDLIAVAPGPVIEMPRLIQRLAYPTYFDDLVLVESQAYNIDPLLTFALIRQESLFDDQVASWAGAVGLAQIMPETGEWIAQMMPWPEYREADLKRAYLNVHFGLWFMSRILDMTQGHIPAALAGYNGGPGNGVRWQESSGGDPDLFVEVIDRDEPRRYVREIYRHYDMYVRLYGGEPF